MIPYLKAHVDGQKYLQDGLRLMSLYNGTNAIIELVLNGVDHSWDHPAHGSALTVALKHKRGHSALALVAAGARPGVSDATEITFDLDVKVMFTRLQAAVALGNAAFLKRAMDEDAEPGSLLERSLQAISWAEKNYSTPDLQISKSMIHRMVAIDAINEIDWKVSAAQVI